MTQNLRPIVKHFAGTLRQDGSGRVLRRECWEAITVDGEWGFERIDDVGTPWIVVHHPRTPQAETASMLFGTLKAARQAIEHAWVTAELPSVNRAAHERGEHAFVRYGCPTCHDEETARWTARREATGR